MAARPLRGRAAALPWPTATDGPSSGSGAALACPAVPPPATRSSPAGVRGAVAHPGPRGGRPAAPARSPRGQGCAGARSSSAPPTPPRSVAWPAGGAPAALGSGMRLPVRSRPVSALRVATLAPRGVSWFVPTPRASRRVPLEHRAYRQPPSVCPSALTRHAARCPRPPVLRLGAALPSGHGSPPSPPRGCRQSDRPDSRESGPCRGGLP